MVGATIALTLGVAFISFVLLKALRLPLPSFLPALTLGNTGNLGLPLCLFAFGEQGLGLAVAVYVTNSVLQFTFVPLLQATRVGRAHGAHDADHLRPARVASACC